MERSRKPRYQTQSLYRVQIPGHRDGHVDVWATTPAAAARIAASHARRTQGGTVAVRSVSQVSRKIAEPVNQWEKRSASPDAAVD